LGGEYELNWGGHELAWAFGLAWLGRGVKVGRMHDPTSTKPVVELQAGGLLASALGKKILFTSLYFSEGAPIGFIWLALPVWLKKDGAPIEQITTMTGLVVLPWTFKFLWAPLVDILQSRWWTLRSWIILAQVVMAITILPLVWYLPTIGVSTLTLLLLVHAFFAATQDVAIDALCIHSTRPEERGSYNGWMQAGMLLGRAALGGGALMLATSVGRQAVVGLLVVSIMIPLALVVFGVRAPVNDQNRGGLKQFAGNLRKMFSDSRLWLGLAFGLTGGAVFKSLEVFYGPLLVDRGYDEHSIGLFTSTIMIGSMIAGSLTGGWLADRFGRKRIVGVSLVWIVLSVGLLSHFDRILEGAQGIHFWILLASTAMGIGVFTASLYAFFMGLTRPGLAATQFSALMGSTNGCESWSVIASGSLIAWSGYNLAMSMMCVVSLLALMVLWPIPDVRAAHSPGVD